MSEQVLISVGIAAAFAVAWIRAAMRIWVLREYIFRVAKSTDDAADQLAKLDGSIPAPMLAQKFKVMASNLRDALEKLK